MRRLLQKFSFKQTAIGVADLDVSISTYQTVCMGTDSTFLRSSAVPYLLLYLVTWRMQGLSISSSARQSMSWFTRSQDGRIPGLPSTATKLAFTCKFIVKKTKNLFNPHVKGTCLSFSWIPKPQHRIKKCWSSVRTMVPHKIASVNKFPFFSFPKVWNDIDTYSK